MDLSSGSAKLQFALKTLRQRWQETKTQWNDTVRQDFEENHLNPLEIQVSAALGEMSRLNQVLQKAQQECA